MEKSKVYFSNLHTTPENNLLKKFQRLLTKAGMLDIDFANKMVAIKLHFGEPGNLSYIRPNYAAVLVNMITEKEGLPFLTDCNTLYKGRRSNAVDHLKSARENGFNPLTTHCDVIIADGIKGTDYREIEINQKNCKTAKIGTAIADADVIISLTHFKGHEMTGFGGCLKNIGMGCGSVGGKLEMHSEAKPRIVEENCTGCRTCEKNCAHDAIHVNRKSKKAEINYENCVGCGQCIAVCRYDAAQSDNKQAAQKLQEKIAEYTLAVVKDKPAFHINLIMNVSPLCDCWGYNDVAIVHDIGMVASFDPVAIDKASSDLVNQAVVNKQSVIGDKVLTNKEDKFDLLFPHIDHSKWLDYAQEIGLGNQDYELITID